MEIQWQDSLGAALAQAQREQKPLLADFWSPGCKGCAAFDGCTYESDEVQKEINEHFIPLKFNTNKPPAGLVELLRFFKPLWTPTLIFFDHRSHELGRLVGYVPPDEFLGQLRIARGKHALLYSQPGTAYNLFNQVSEESRRLAPEALYWAGVAAFYRDGKSLNSLTPLWERIGSEYPTNPWWDRANVLQQSDRGIHATEQRQ